MKPLWSLSLTVTACKENIIRTSSLLVPRHARPNKDKLSLLTANIDFEIKVGGGTKSGDRKH